MDKKKCKLKCTKNIAFSVVNTSFTEYKQDNCLNLGGLGGKLLVI